jgi:beta-glucosidase
MRQTEVPVKRLCFALASVVVLLVACTGSPTPLPTATVSPTPAVPLYQDPSQPVEARVEDLLARMTLDEKIGQMTQVENNSIQPEAVATYLIGSVLSGGGGISDTNRITEWADLAHSYEEQALQTRLAIPLIFGVDSVHGFSHVNGATIFPHNIGLGATHDPNLVRQIGFATAEEMRAAGIPWNFAPVVAVPQDVRWGRTYEGFSEDTALVTELSSAYIQGYQSLPDGFSPTPGQTLYAGATAKHFIGDGATIWGSSTQNIDGVRYRLDQGNVQAPEETLRALYFPPYQAAVQDGVMSVMASFSSWRGVKMHAQKYLITDVLKGELGFQGFVVSDWGGIEQVNEDYYTAVVTSINAGVDMDMVPYDYITFITLMKQAVDKGDVTQERIDDAVRRILRAKFELGLFENPYGDRSLLATVGSPEHRALARQAVRESLVLLKNANDALPIDKNVSTILVAGRGANNTGFQAGGWTLDWQGVSSNILQGSTILDGVRASVGPNTQVMYDINGKYPDLNGVAPVGIVVTAEDPYAEGEGDRADLSLYPADVQVIERLRPLVQKLIVVILSGRPMVITDQYQEVDAWVAAWLPGSEGNGVTDVLFGDYPFVGTLPYSWPRSNEQLPINENNDSGLTGCNAPLFPVGYGLGQAGSPPIQWIDCP